MSRKIKSLTYEQKLCLVKDQVENKMTNSQLSEKYKIPRSTVVGIVKSRDKIMEQSHNERLGQIYRTRVNKYSELEQRLYGEYSLLQQDYLRAFEINETGENTWFERRAKELATEMGIVSFKGSNNWLRNFKVRFNLASPPIPRPSKADPSELPPIQETAYNQNAFETEEIEMIPDHHYGNSSAGTPQSPPPEAEMPDPLPVTAQEAIKACTVLIQYSCEHPVSSKPYLPHLLNYLNKLVAETTNSNNKT